MSDGYFLRLFCSADIPFFDIRHSSIFTHIHLIPFIMSTFIPFSVYASIVSFLTDALIPSLHPLILHSLRLHLYAYLPMHFTTSSTLRLPFDLPTTIGPHSLWITALGTSPISISVSPACVRATFANGRVATLWEGAPPDSDDSDSDSDSEESDGYMSEESMTSVSSSSRAPSPIPVKSKPVSLPFSSSPTTYLYQGGRTNVVTGRVMLGKPTSPRPLDIKSMRARAESSTAPTRSTKTAASSLNWRTRC